MGNNCFGLLLRIESWNVALLPKRKGNSVTFCTGLLIVDTCLKMNEVVLLDTSGPSAIIIFQI